MVAAVGSLSSLTIASWNIRGIGGIAPTRLDRQTDALAGHHADVVVLTEVRSLGDLAERLRERLAGIGLCHFISSGPQVLTEKPYGDKAYGNVIASRWSLEPRSWPVETMWPQLIVAADIDWCGSRVRIVGVHIPNGSANGWQKIYAFETLACGLVRDAMPTILAGDFNEPKTFDPFLSFGTTRSGGLNGTFTDLHGVTHPRRRWQDAVESVLTPRSRAEGGWGGRHVVLQAGGDFEPTHLAGIASAEKCFDHILTSGTLFRVTAAAYDHAVREGDNRLSDHSMIVASMESTDLAQVDDVRHQAITVNATCGWS